jgi:adenosylhomocysteine nucleosidase
MMAFTGVAGAIDPSLSVGDLVVARRTIQHDAGVITPGGLERYQAGHVPFFNPTDAFGYEPSPGLLAAATSVIDEIELRPVLDRHPLATLGTIVTGDQFLQDPVTRDRLLAELSAQVIEMEGAALAQFTSRVGCDHIVVRSVSDLAGEESTIDFERFLPEVAGSPSPSLTDTS